jgi:pimeloyl-ACP methyl ester carboxylesterase
MSSVESTATISGFRSETVFVAGVRLHYWIGGDPQGQPAILWHGFLGSGYTWRRVAPLLAASGLSVLVPDMRGYGRSDKPEGLDGYDARALAEECRALATKIGFGDGRRVILAAHDMGAPPALLWAADHPLEIAGLLYIDEPVMLAEVLQRIINYSSETMKRSTMWWWILALAPGVPEALIVGNERAFLNWFYQGRTVAKREAFDSESVDEHVRAFTGREAVLGALGVYRAAFVSIEQTEPLAKTKVKTPIVALGGEKGLGSKVGEWVKLIAEHVEAFTIPDCGHYIPEECPDIIVKHILAVAGKIATDVQPKG